MTPRTPARIRNVSAALLAAVAAFSALFYAIFPAPPLPFRVADPGHELGEPVRFSLLAVGDTGRKHWLPSLRAGQLAVARELTAADLARPADTLVLLGDNFYPSGLRAAELIPRVRRNLVRPYCRFVALDGRDSGAVAEACTLPAALRRRDLPSIHAVLGNHDHKDPESPTLQSLAVPRFISNWHASVELVDVVEFDAGISLILVDSSTVTTEEHVRRVRDALRRARGPWRIAVAHHPIARLDPEGRGEPEPSGPLLRRAIEEAGVSVHVFLSGHHHNLQGIEMETPSRILHLIAGSGANIRPVEHDYVNRTIALESSGFARIDLVATEGREALVAELWETERYPVVFWREARRVARWRISPSNALSRDLPRDFGR